MEISVDFDEVRRIVKRHRQASMELSDNLADVAPRHIDAGQASDAIAKVMTALLNKGGGSLAQYGVGLAVEAEDAVGELEDFDSGAAESLSTMTRTVLGGGN